MKPDRLVSFCDDSKTLSFTAVQVSPMSALEARKGAVRAADIPEKVLEGLNAGTLESVNLTEWLAVDGLKLLTVLPTWKLKRADDVLEVAREVTGLGVMQRTERLALALAATNVKLEVLAKHPSDTVRCWAAYIAVNRALDLKTALEAIKPFAADSHFGVREIAWMAWRPLLAAKLEPGIKLLEKWTKSDDANVRRFASEASRPCGVWCAHIQALKDQPELALRILEPLRSDPDRYVQTSVANWLNDASKSQPVWVEALCKRWLEESLMAETGWIVNHALRSVRKAKA
jgi:3-methyladenine DNA glycosylase AlkC